MNECDPASGQARCDKNAVCTNTDGSFSCTCSQGFAGDGFTCRGRLSVVSHSVFALYCLSFFYYFSCFYLFF